ncbi:hypothetical protein V6Z11_D08G061000 [Gossypium hirsutum]
MPSSLFFSIRVHLRQQSTSTDPPLVLHGSTHFQNQRLERSYKRLLQTSTCTFAWKMLEMFYSQLYAIFLPFILSRRRYEM